MTFVVGLGHLHALLEKVGHADRHEQIRQDKRKLRILLCLITDVLRAMYRCMWLAKLEIKHRGRAPTENGGETHA
jgi:hypothetical protein